jgi:hypothetical protein
VFIFANVVCLFVNNVFAQESNYEKDLIYKLNFQLNQNSSMILNNKNILSSKNQVKNSLIEFNQVGVENLIDIRNNFNDGQSITQKGDNNNYHFINFYSNLPSDFNILQQGNSNSLQIYGENSLIKHIKIVQKTNFKTIIIKNY